MLSRRLTGRAAAPLPLARAAASRGSALATLTPAPGPARRAAHLCAWFKFHRQPEPGAAAVAAGGAAERVGCGSQGVRHGTLENPPGRAHGLPARGREPARVSRQAVTVSHLCTRWRLMRHPSERARAADRELQVAASAGASLRGDAAAPSGPPSPWWTAVAAGRRRAAGAGGGVGQALLSLADCERFRGLPGRVVPALRAQGRRRGRLPPPCPDARPCCQTCHGAAAAPAPAPHPRRGCSEARRPPVEGCSAACERLTRRGPATLAHTGRPAPGRGRAPAGEGGAWGAADSGPRAGRTEPGGPSRAAVDGRDAAADRDGRRRL